MDLATELAFAMELVDLAADISLPRFASRDYTVKAKSDGSPVTEVDRAVETAVRARITARRENDVVIGEEHGRSGPVYGDRCWYLDPIDGTTRFLIADPQWTTLVALAVRGQVVLGIVDLPAMGQRWWASRGNGAFRDGRPVTVSRTDRLTEAVICDDWRQHIAADNRDHPLVQLAARCGRVRPHDGPAALAVACGEADLALSSGGAPWDYAAPRIIVQEAGGRHTDLAGTARLDTGQVLVTNGRVHDTALELLRH